MMASYQLPCPFHKESSLSLCLNHGIYCCAHCHFTSNAGCIIKTVVDAVKHFQFEAQTSRVMLRKSTQRCADRTMYFMDLQGVIRKNHGEAIDSVRTLCDILRSAASRLETDAILDVNQAALGRENSLKTHVDSVEILSEFNGTLNRLLDVDGEWSPTQQQERTSLDNDLNKIRNEIQEFRDGLSVVSERLNNIECLRFDEFHATFHIDKSIVENLIDELSGMCLDANQEQKARQLKRTSTHMRTSSERSLGSESMETIKPLPIYVSTTELDEMGWDHCSTVLRSEHTDEIAGCVLPNKSRTTVYCGYIADEQKRKCEMRNIADADYEQRCSMQSHSTDSAVADSYSTECSEPVCSSVEPATILSSAETAQLPMTTAHEGCITNGNLNPPVFIKHRELCYKGRDAIVCFVPTAAGHLLLATREPNVLNKYDVNGNEIVCRESPTWINDMCVRGTRIYATFADCSVRVLDVDTLSNVETFCGIGACHGIDSFGTYFVMTWPDGYHKGVYLVGIKNGVLRIRRKSVCVFKRPMFVTSSTALDTIVVSDIYDNSDTILSAGLCPIRKLKLKTNMMRPNGMCMVDESVLIVCHQSKTIVEFGINCGNSRTIFSSNDAIGSPRTISFHKESRRLILSSTANPKSALLFKCKELECEESGSLQLEDGRSEMPSTDSDWHPSTTQIDKTDPNNRTEIKAVTGNRGSATYRKLFEFSYKGFDPVARYIQSRPAYILLTTKQPNMIRKLSESGKEFVCNETAAGINDFCIRDVEIYTSDSDGKILVYNIGNLSPLRTIVCAFQECRGICTIGEGIAILQKSQGRWCFTRISVIGEIKGTSSQQFKHPLFVALDPRSNGVGLVTDVTDNCIVAVQGNLSSSRTISHPLIRQPRGMCTVGVNVYVACHESRSVIELHSDYRYRKAILTAVDGIGVPRTISFHKKSGHLVVSSSADPKKIIIFSREG